METFPIRPYTKKELALCYFPTSSPSVSVHHLMAWINNNSGLLETLTELGYEKTQKMFSPKQVTAIIDYLGAPGDYD